MDDFALEQRLSALESQSANQSALPTDDNDLKIRGLQSQLDSLQRTVDDLNNLLQQYGPKQIYAFDAGSNPISFMALSEYAGSWPGIISASPLPFSPYQVPNPDAPGTPLIGITPSTITDSTNSDEAWSPTLAGTPINTIPAPSLSISTSATCLYFKSTITTASGKISAIEIDADTGGGIPPSTDAIWYLLLSGLTVTVTSGVASVVFYYDGFCNAPIIYSVCETLPLMDGNGYRWGT